MYIKITNNGTGTTGGLTAGQSRNWPLGNGVTFIQSTTSNRIASVNFGTGGANPFGTAAAQTFAQFTGSNVLVEFFAENRIVASNR